ncbi:MULTISPECIES: PEP-CTERM sorting domain-containing protein [Methylomonas]|uniref:PEP-CTERM sorting domain-containing protein n=1 Tax=Methylomonas TaxID=416 RepID=UPI001681AE70|nr:PEP-CTERM sorting domain-containing protein [Methylomonas rhizoryzae]
MFKFTKLAVAMAMLAGAGAANASVMYYDGGNNEAYLSAYDWTTGKTFTLDTGITYDELVANQFNTSYALNYDLSNDPNWQNFITGANTSVIKYVVAVGNSVGLGAAITMDGPLYPTAGEDYGIFWGSSVASAIEGHAIDVNAGLVQDRNLNDTKLSLDTDSPMTGQHGYADSIWGSWIQDPQVAYGESVAFQLGVMDIVVNPGDNLTSTFVQRWTLAGNSLTFEAPAAVPVPGAVWLFGTGLLGLLGARRKANA